MFEINPVQISLIKKCYDYDRFSDAGYQWRKVFVVDDFYKNPDEVRDYCLLYTSPSPRDVEESRMPSSA